MDLSAPRAAKELQYRLKATTAQLLLSVAMTPGTAAVGYESIQAHPDSPYLWAAVSVFWALTTLPLLASFLLGPFITSVAFALAEGQVEELAAQARQTAAATAD